MNINIEVVTIRKVDLNMTEEQKYTIIKKLVETNGNKDRAAKILGCTKRHINRLIKGYLLGGKSFFLHGNRGRKPANTFPTSIKNNVIDLYRTKYYDANFTHFSELLQEHEDISISTSTINNILMAENILSPKARRITKKKIRLQLEEQKKAAKSKTEIARIDENILLLEDAHPRRPRCAFFGEMLQMDASVHHWFGQDKAQLHIAIDDATGAIVGAYFDHQETLKGYYNVFHQVLRNHGIPYMFYTDRRTVFEYKQKNTPSIEEDTFTQFGYACQQLGVELKTTSIPQAKGRIERLFETLQSRLTVELRLKGITTIEQANKFLNSYIKKFNARFAIPINNIKSVFEKQPDEEKTNLTLAILTGRKIDNGHCIRFENNFYKPLDAQGLPVYYHKGTPAMVIKAFDGNVFACINERVYFLDLIPKHELSSKNFDIKPAFKPIKRHIPAMTHPWRQAAFAKFIKKQNHRFEQDFESLIQSQALIYA